MIRNNHRRAITPLTPCVSSRHHNATNRPEPKYNLLRPGRRRRPHSIPTLILILWTPRSLYFNFTRIWNNFPHCNLLLRKKRTIRIHRNSLGYNVNWVFRLHRMSSPYIHSRNRCRHTSLLHISHYNYCHSNRSKSFQLTGNTSWRKYQMISCYNMSPGFYLLIYSRRPNRNCIGQLFSRYRSSRHILRCRTFPLCFINRSCVCYYRGICSLIPTILRLYPQ